MKLPVKIVSPTETMGARIVKLLDRVISEAESFTRYRRLTELNRHLGNLTPRIYIRFHPGNFPPASTRLEIWSWDTDKEKVDFSVYGEPVNNPTDLIALLKREKPRYYETDEPSVYMGGIERQLNQAFDREMTRTKYENTRAEYAQKLRELADALTVAEPE